MRSRIRTWIHTGLVVALLAGSQTGCKSGWKMPSSDMFSWGRKPSESTLVGSGPSVSTPGATTASTSPSTLANSPTSPAMRSTPNAVSSVAVHPSAAGRPGGTSFGGYGPTGAAASSNGYMTGAYATNQARVPTGVSSAPYGQPGMNLPSSGVQPTNRQAATPQLSNPQIPLAQGTAPIPTANPNYSYPASAPVYNGMPLARGPAPVASAPTAGLPPNAVPSGFPVASPTASAGLPAIPASTGSNLPPGLPPSPQMPMAYGGTAPSSMPVMSAPSASGTSPYRPGSVGRSTPYDFSNQGPGVQGPGTVPAAPAPSLPRTATDPSSLMNR